MSRQALYKIPVKMLSDLASPRALERILQDAAAARGTEAEALDYATLDQILKNEVYKRLQQTVPAPLAKKRVTEVLKELEKAPQPSLNPTRVIFENQIASLEEQSKKFTLYFDWPETQRLRGVLGIARTEEEAGRGADALVQEGQDLIAQMERKLQEGLVAQAQDLAELKAAFTRVQSMGGRDVRRLENLITQIDEAQEQSTLIPGEVERARNITFKLRKSLESSVVEGVPSSSSTPALDPQAHARVQALEQEHVARQLTDLSRDFAPLLRARPELQLQNDEIRLRHSSGSLDTTAIEAWRTALEQARSETLESQRAELAALEAKLTHLPEGPAAHDIRVALDVARLTLSSGSLATDELGELRVSASALSHSPVEASRILEQQRELAELERSAREIPGVEEELREQLHAARETLAHGQDLDLSPLWATLERRMGQAAQQREDFDARADHVIHEYDQVRSLAGETTQRLGRLAETLRAQRRLGKMSGQARERYAQTLTDAEALLTEARAEYQAAQEVTSTFGQDALSDLLDVFDFGAGGPDSAPAPAAPPAFPQKAAAPPASVFDSLLAAPVGPVSVELWRLRDGQIVSGTPNGTLNQVATLLSQADRLGLHRLDMGDDTHVWSARSAGPAEWRLARARNWDDLERGAGHWLDSGQE